MVETQNAMEARGHGMVPLAFALCFVHQAFRVDVDLGKIVLVDVVHF